MHEAMNTAVATVPNPRHLGARASNINAVRSKKKDTADPRERRRIREGTL